jgi:uncharacterized membrane protein
MELGRYADGRSLNYDETTHQFDVGGAPVTIADVVAYDQAGQVDWLTDELRSWAQNLESGFAAGTQTHGTMPDPSAETQSGKGLFGFRSRTPWKMVVASLYYLFAVVTSIGLILSRKPYASSGTDIAIEVLSGLLLSLVLLSPAILLSDFGYRDKLPLFKRRKLIWSALGLALFFVLVSVTSALADTLHTQPYKVAAAAERAAQEKEAARQQAEADAKDAAEAKRQAEADADAKREAEADARMAAETEAKREAEANAAAEAKRLEQERTEAAKATKPAEDETPIISMGQTVTVGKFEYVVNSTTSTKELGTAPFNQTTNDEYLVVNLSIKNKDSKSRMMDASMFEIIDTAGNVYEPDGGAVMYLDASFFLEDVNPGLTRTGDIVFEIPEGLSGLSLRVGSGVGFAAGTSEVIKLDR